MMHERASFGGCWRVAVVFGGASSNKQAKRYKNNRLCRLLDSNPNMDVKASDPMEVFRRVRETETTRLPIASESSAIASRGS
jgi:hypothetical protein